MGHKELCVLLSILQIWPQQPWLLPSPNKDTAVPYVGWLRQSHLENSLPSSLRWRESKRKGFKLIALYRAAALANARGCHLYSNGIGSVRLWQTSRARDCSFWRGALHVRPTRLLSWVWSRLCLLSQVAGARQRAHVAGNQLSGHRDWRAQWLFLASLHSTTSAKWAVNTDLQLLNCDDAGVLL